MGAQRKHVVRAKKYLGQDASGRIDFTDSTENALLLKLAGKGYHAALIARMTGLTKGQVYTRCQQLDVRLRDYRNGETEEAKEDLKQQEKLLILPKSNDAVRTALRTMRFKRQFVIRKSKK